MTAPAKKKTERPAIPELPDGDGGLPWMPLEVDACLLEPGLARCSPAAKGVWWWLIMHMWKVDQRGELKGTTRALARLAACDREEFEAALLELQDEGVAEVEPRLSGTSVPDVVTVTNRRMSRSWAKREAKRKTDRDRQARKRTSDRHGGVTPAVTPESRNGHALGHAIGHAEEGQNSGGCHAGVAPLESRDQRSDLGKITPSQDSEALLRARADGPEEGGEIWALDARELERRWLAHTRGLHTQPGDLLQLQAALERVLPHERPEDVWEWVGRVFEAFELVAARYTKNGRDPDRSPRKVVEYLSRIQRVLRGEWDPRKEAEPAPTTPGNVPRARDGRAFGVSGPAGHSKTERGW